MKWSNKNPLIPTSLATDGNQGAEATADSRHLAQHIALRLIRRGVAVALLGCEVLSYLTDDPAPGFVEAADHIEAAANHLTPSDAGVGGVP